MRLTQKRREGRLHLLPLGVSVGKTKFLYLCIYIYLPIYLYIYLLRVSVVTVLTNGVGILLWSILKQYAAQTVLKLTV